MDKVTTWLWCDGTAAEMAALYTGLFANSQVEAITRAPMAYPAGEEGAVLTIEFTLAGRSFVALNGGAGPAYTEAMSLQVLCDDQAEVDRLWAALSVDPDGGQCGWTKDRFGVSWQIVPRRMIALLADPDRARAARAMRAMMDMKKLDLAALEAAADAG